MLDRPVHASAPEGWREVEPGKWEFTAVGGSDLDGAGRLPLRPG
ncbi:hypothetical protein ACFWRV_04205 [Streptomyces sp. NPDC058576]